MISISEKNESLFDQVGEELLERLLAHADVWGVGPLFLTGSGDVSLDRQEQLFSAFVRAAVAADAAIVVASSEFSKRQIELLRQGGADFGRVALLNSTLGLDELQPWVDAGAYVAFDGYLTYPQNVALREAARALPLDRILCASNQPTVSPCAIAQVPGGAEDVVWVIGEIVELRGAFQRDAFMEVYDALLNNAQAVLGLRLCTPMAKNNAWYH